MKRSKFWFSTAVLIIVALMASAFAFVPLTSARASAPIPPIVIDWSTIFTTLLLQQFLALLGLTVLQVLFAVSLALKTKTFEWGKLADFYRSLVVPYILGWIGLTILAKLAAGELLGPYAVLVGDGVTWVAYLVIVASLGGRIISTAKELYGSMVPFPTPEA